MGVSVLSHLGHYQDVFEKFNLRYITLHGVGSGFDLWLFITHYRHLTLLKLMTPTLLKNEASERRCGSITASLQNLTKKMETFK